MQEHRKSLRNKALNFITEFYYWDSYWIIEGLLLCDMPVTVKGMIENFLSMVERYGFIPNGGRVYYLMRSQPPMLIPMVRIPEQRSCFSFCCKTFKSCIEILSIARNSFERSVSLALLSCYFTELRVCFALISQECLPGREILQIHKRSLISEAKHSNA